MFSLTPITFFIILFFIFQKSIIAPSWRISFLSASLVWGLILTATTEALNLFGLIGYREVLGVWVLSVILALIYLLRIYQVNGNNGKLNIRLGLTEISFFDILLLACITFIIITVGVIAWISPPNTWDSMTYHMSRVMHWIQNGSVEFYPTNILRQLHQNPWAEYAIMHFQILNGSDRFANLIQWFSMVGATLGVSLIAKQFGASPRTQIFAAIFSVTIPMGILQGSSTQTDYVVSFWLVCFTYFAISFKKNGKYLYSLAVGVSLGLAILTKATAYIYAFPFMVWIGLSLIKWRRMKGLWQIALILIIAIAINIGHYSRNYDLYSNPLGSGQEGEGYKYSNDIFTFASTTSNVIRNLGLHLGTPFHTLNQLVKSGVYRFHKVIGIDTNDPRTTWAGTTFSVDFSIGEDTAGNFLHLGFIIITAIFILHQRRQSEVFFYIVCLLVASVLFCIYLKWQPWNSRLHLPLFILWAPFIGLSFSRIRLHKIVNLCIVLLLLNTIPYLLINKNRPIIGQKSILTTSRTELYFRGRPSLLDPYTSSVQFFLKSQCSNIGLVMGGDDWEYPFWVLLQENTKRPIRIEHVSIENISAKYNKYPFKAFTPCVVIIVSNNLPNEFNIGNINYLRKMISNPIGVFMQK